MNSNKNKIIFSLSTLLLIIMVSFLVYQKEHKNLAAPTQTITKKNSIKATPLKYTGYTLLNKFNKATIENYPTAAGTYDLATMASNITSQMIQAFSDTGTRTLPLVANWNVGIPEYSDGLDPLYMINKLTNGESLIPTWKLDPYYNDNIGLSYYETSIKKAAALGLPLVFILPSPESALTKDDVYFTMDKTNNPNVITPKGIVLPKLSPFGPDSLWNEVGGQWSTTSLMAQLQEWYPNPPLVIFIDEDSASKLSWSELSNSSRYQTQYPSDATDEFKRTLVNAQWVEKYRQLHQGFVQGFTNDAWKKNAKFITRNQLAINMGTSSDWKQDATTTNLQANVWPLTANGLTINFDISEDKELLNNLPFMLDEAKNINPNFVSQLSIDAHQKITNPNTYRGYTQLALWLLRPNIIRQTSYGTTKADINPLFQEVVDSVELINNNDIFADFWKNGKLVQTGNSPYTKNIPAAYKNVPREFLLKTNANSPVWAFALMQGTTPNREWLVYAQSPEGNLSDISVSIPNYNNIDINTTSNGNFYTLHENNKRKTNINTHIPLNNYIKVFSISGAINIKDFGAIGDGITDDSESLKNALSSSSKVYIPAGNYLVTQKILIPNSVHLIYGEGTLIGKNNQGILSSRGLNNLIIDGLSLRFSPDKSTIFGAIYLDGITCTNITIQNCTFIGSSVLSNAILLVGKDQHLISNFTIVNNKFINITRAAIEILERSINSDPMQIIINTNIIDNNFTYDSNAKIPTDFNPAISLSSRVNNTLIQGNIIDNYIWGIETAHAANTNIISNKITNVRDPINSNSGSINNNITNNFFQFTDRAQFKDDYNATIISNTFDGGSLYLLKAHNAYIKDNNIISNAHTNVWLDNSQDCTIIDNYIENNNIEAWDAIRGYGDKSDSSNRVTNNTIFMQAGHSLVRNVNNSKVFFSNNIRVQKP